VLEHRRLDTLCAPEALHDACVLVPDVALDDVLNRFDFVETVVESHDLANELGALGH